MIRTSRFISMAVMIALMPLMMNTTVHAMDLEDEETAAITSSRTVKILTGSFKAFAGLCLARLGATNFLSKKNALIKDRDENGEIKKDSTTGQPAIKKDEQGNDMQKGLLNALNPFTPLKDLKLQGRLAKIYAPGTTGVTMFIDGILTIAQALGFIVSAQEEERCQKATDLWQ